MAYTKQNFEDGQVLTAEHLNNMESGIAAPDWEQMVNKPFGDALVEIMPETEMTPTEDDGAYFVEGTIDGLEAGAQITVVFDDTEYVCDYYNIFSGNYFYGNPGIHGLGDDNGLPFNFIYITAASMYSIDFQDANTHTVGISVAGVKKIDSKYVPNDFLWIDGTYLYKNSDTTVESNRASKEELSEFCKANGVVILRDAANDVWSISFSTHIDDSYGVVYTQDTDGTISKLYTSEYTG